MPGSHRTSNNPTGNNGIDPAAPYPTELNATGTAGSVLLSIVASGMPQPKSLAGAAGFRRGAIRPWWLNLEVLRPVRLKESRWWRRWAAGENEVPAIPVASFEQLPEGVRPLFRHWVSA